MLHYETSANADFELWEFNRNHGTLFCHGTMNIYMTISAMNYYNISTHLIFKFIISKVHKLYVLPRSVRGRWRRLILGLHIHIIKQYTHMLDIL